MKTIRHLLAYERCEVLITFMVGFVNRFAQQQPETVDQLYDATDWRCISNLQDPQGRERQWIDLYEQAMKPEQTPGQRQVPEGPTAPESPHEHLKFKIKEIGEVLGKKCHVEFSAAPYSYDVVWKEVEGLPPSHVFEVQDKGSLNGALSKLQHARDIWRPKLFFVITGEKDRSKVDLLLKPYVQGTFHRIAGETLVLTPEVVDQIHTVLMGHTEVLRRFIED